MWTVAHPFRSKNHAANSTAEERGYGQTPLVKFGIIRPCARANSLLMELRRLSLKKNPGACCGAVMRRSPDVRGFKQIHQATSPDQSREQKTKNDHPSAAWGATRGVE